MYCSTHIEDPAATASAVNEFLGGKLDEEKMAGRAGGALQEQERVTLA
jgi:hypothetical protein